MVEEVGGSNLDRDMSFVGISELRMIEEEVEVLKEWKRKEKEELWKVKRE